MGLGNDDPGPAHFGHRGIGVSVVGLRLACCADFAELRHRAFLSRPVARHVAQHFLFFAENCHCPCSRRLLVVEHAKHPLGNDVVLDFGRTAIDRRCLAEEPAAHILKFVIAKLVAFPAEALKAADFDQ